VLAAGGWLVATAAQTFQQKWRIGRQVQEIVPPYLTGHIKAVQGTGYNARITVTVPGRGPVTLRPYQLVPL
jgi:hypothetical protein